MIARFHYDRETYRRFLNDELPQTEEQTVLGHVETCEDCQATLELVSQDQVDWQKVPGLLTRDGSSDSERLDRTKLDFLRETDQPDSLGRFGRFEIVEYLGCGGMGIVLKGYDPALNRFSAIKVLAPVLATSAAARKRFAREAKSAAAVVHEHVVPIQTVDEENGLPYLAMPVVDGQSLQERVEEHGPLEIKEVLRIGMQIASGLAAAHAQGLVHRDVKPANVLLENGVERVMLTDFGLARAADDANMTQSGVIAGTPQYMSPEQAQGLNVDQKSDLFSLGSVIYFMCTGHSPFRANNTFGVLSRIVEGRHRPIRQINPDVPAWLQGIVGKLLEKEKGKRYESAAEVAEVFEQWLSHLQQPDVIEQPPTPKPSSGFTGDHSWSRTLMAAVGAFVLLLAGFFLKIEMDKGTVTIESVDDSIPIRITSGDRIVKQLTVSRGATATRIAAGKYEVHIEAETDRLEVKEGEFTLSRGGAAIAKIVEKPSTRKNDTYTATKTGAGRDQTSGPVSVELVEGTETFIVRGKRNDVERVVELIGRVDSKKENPTKDHYSWVPKINATPNGEAFTLQWLKQKPEHVMRAINKLSLASDSQIKIEQPNKASAVEGTVPFPKEVKQVDASRPTVLLTMADWCQTCKSVEKWLDGLVATRGYRLKKIDVSNAPNEVEAIPRLAVEWNGKEKAEFKGAFNSQAVGYFLALQHAMAKHQADPDKKLINYLGAWPQETDVNVIDEAGRPVKGAVVFRNHVYSSKGDRPTQIENKHYETDSHGTAKVELSGPPLDLRLWIRKTGYVPMHAMWAIDMQSDGDEIPRRLTVVLNKGTKIGGRLVDVEGQPIVGARVELMDATLDYSVPSKPTRGERPKRSNYLADGKEAPTTDEDGRWVFHGAPNDVLLATELFKSRSASDWAYKNKVVEQPIAIRVRHPDYVDNDWGEIQTQQNISLEALREQSATIRLWKRGDNNQRMMKQKSEGVRSPSWE